MRWFGIPLIVSLIFTVSSFAEEFFIYAPSRESKTVQTVKATPSDSGLKLLKAREIKATFAARTITSNRAGNILFVSGTPNSVGENGAVIYLTEGGA